jgi:hypothetical protein
MNKKHLTISSFNELIKRKNAIVTKKDENGTIPTHLIWIDNQEFMDLLCISRKTSQNYRERKLIGYATLGAKEGGRGGRVYYKLSEVLAFLEKNYKSIDRP